MRHDGPSGSSQRPIVLDDTANSDVEISDDDYQGGKYWNSLETLSFLDAPEPMDDDDFLLAQPSRLEIFCGIWEVYYFFLGLVSSLSFLTILVMKPWVESSLGKNLETDMVGQSLIWDQIDLND